MPDPFQDCISTAAAGRVFPMTVPEVIRTAHRLCLAENNPRLAVHLQNERGLSEFGTGVAGYYPGCAVVVFSIDCNEDLERAKYAVAIALDQFSAIAQEWGQAKLRDVLSDKVEVSLWAYRGTLGKLKITKRIRRASSRTFRGGGRLLCRVKSPKPSDTHEAIVATVQLGASHLREA